MARAGGSDRAKGVNPADPSERGDLLVVGCPFAQERLFEHYQVRGRVRARARVRIRVRVRARARVKVRVRVRVRVRVKLSGRSP